MKLPASRETLIVHFMPKVEKTISTFVWRNPHFLGVKDDLISASVIKMIEVVDRFIERKNDNFAHLSNYIRISVMTGVSDFVRDNSTIRAPKDTWVLSSTLVSDPVDPRSIRDNTMPDRLKGACRNVVERTVLKMTTNGSSRKEIAQYLCLSQSEVRDIAGGILERAKNG